MKIGSIVPIARGGTLESRELLRLVGSAEMRKAKARTTGEYRKPKAGEWYVSGAIPEAYFAPEDLTGRFYICRVVITEMREVVLQEFR